MLFEIVIKLVVYIEKFNHQHTILWFSYYLQTHQPHVDK